MDKISNINTYSHILQFSNIILNYKISKTPFRFSFYYCQRFSILILNKMRKIFSPLVKNNQFIIYYLPYSYVFKSHVKK